ncbi:hypothetical protein ACFYU5_04690 [Nocardia aobensis]|uniref:Uncharacterized protein n=1 Tax=Nocardia aobensis TaxID=257277 RepID=A0ABW6NZB9_9NOCA
MTSWFVHPLDDPRVLRDEYRADEPLTRLVVNHTFALLEAKERGLRDGPETAFPLLDDQRLGDALTCADMTTRPKGGRTTPTDRIAESPLAMGPKL